MSNPTPVATAGAGKRSGIPLDGEQLAAFWASIVALEDGACRVARRKLPNAKAAALDVVHSAALLFLESLQRANRPASYPATDQAFRRTFFKIVRNHASDCVRHTETEERPIHSHWTGEREPVVGGRKIADRALDQVFSRNDQNDFDAAAPADYREVDDLSFLGCILSKHIAILPPMQRAVIELTFVQGRKRAQVAAELGISVSTYDNHLQAAFLTLRHLMETDPDQFEKGCRSDWYEVIDDLFQCYAAAYARRLSAAKERRDRLKVAPCASKDGDDPSSRSRVA